MGGKEGGMMLAEVSALLLRGEAAAEASELPPLRPSGECTPIIATLAAADAWEKQRGRRCPMSSLLQHTQGRILGAREDIYIVGTMQLLPLLLTTKLTELCDIAAAADDNEYDSNNNGY